VQEIMRGRSSTKQREVVREVLRSLMPKEAPSAFRSARAAGVEAQARRRVQTLAVAPVSSAVALAHRARCGGQLLPSHPAQRRVCSHAHKRACPLAPPPRRLFPPTKWSAEFNALIASLAFFWLVGDSELREADVAVGAGQVRRQRSLVHIKKCRYLEASGCVGMCTK
jgi:hypothetical protein